MKRAANGGLPKATPRVVTPPSYAYSWYVRLIFALQRRKYGAALESARLWGRMPLVFLMLTLFYRTLDRAVSPEKLAALEHYETSPHYAERERAALAYAEALTDPARRVDGACFARLRAHFEEQAVLELSALAAFQNLSSKFNAALGVPAQGFCVLR